VEKFGIKKFQKKGAERGEIDFVLEIRVEKIELKFILIFGLNFS